MNSADRIAFFESVLDTFVSRTKEKGYITFEVNAGRGEYVQFQVHSGTVYGEVGSRQWEDPERPLPASAVAGLAALGFTGGGPERNYAKDGLPPVPSQLAALTDTLFRTAYDLDEEYAPIIHQLDLKDVALSRAEPFTREMIADLLHAREVTFLRDEDGDFRAEFQCPGSTEVVVIWFIAGGDGHTIYHVGASGPHRPQPATRAEALERCNTWNREHRWPTAQVLDRGDEWQIVTNINIQLGPGITRELFATFTDCAVTGGLDFWAWLAQPVELPAPTTVEGDE